MWRSVFAAALCAVLCSVVHSQTRAPLNGGLALETRAYQDHLKEWLGELVLVYPVAKNPIINKTIAGLQAVLSLKQLRINGISVDRIESHYTEPPGRHIGTGPFSFRAFGLGSSIELEEFHLIAHIPMLGQIDCRGNLTLVLNDTKFGTSLSVTKYDPTFPHMPAFDGAGGAKNSSIMLHVSGLSAVDDPTSKFPLSELLLNYTSKPGFYGTVNDLLDAFIAPTLNPFIDKKMSTLFNKAIELADGLIGNSLVPPPYLPQWPLPGTLNFKELLSAAEKKFPVVASMAKARLSKALVGLATTLINSKFPKIAKRFSLAELAGKSIVLRLPQNTTMNFTITDATVTGLGVVSTLLPIQPICALPDDQRPSICDHHDNNQTVRTSLGLKSLGLHIVGTLNISGAISGATHESLVLSTDDFRVDITINEPTLHLDTVLGVTNFDAFPLMRLADTSCILAQLDTLQVQSVSLDFDLDHMSVETSARGLRHEIDAMLSSFVTMLVDAYRGTFPAIVNSFIATHEFQLFGGANLTTGVNALLGVLLPDVVAAKKKTCAQETPLVQPDAPPQLIDWSNSSEFLLAKALSTASGKLNNANVDYLNDIISLVTSRQSQSAGRLVIDKTLGSFKFNFLQTGKLNLKITGIEIDHLDSLASIAMLVPESGKKRKVGGATMLDNEFMFAPSCDYHEGGNSGFEDGIEYGNEEGGEEDDLHRNSHSHSYSHGHSIARKRPHPSCGPLNITLKARIEFIGQKFDAHRAFADDISITLALSNVSFATQLNVSVDNNRLKNLTLGALLHGKAWKMAHAAAASRWGENVCVGDSIQVSRHASWGRLVGRAVALQAGRLRERAVQSAS
jgi:hypothetical protein